MKAQISLCICIDWQEPSLLINTKGSYRKRYLVSLNTSNYTTFTNFSTKYHVMCKVYTDKGGIKSYTMFVHLVDYLHVQAENPWYNCYIDIS